MSQTQSPPMSARLHSTHAHSAEADVARVRRQNATSEAVRANRIWVTLLIDSPVLTPTGTHQRSESSIFLAKPSAPDPVDGEIGGFSSPPTRRERSATCFCNDRSVV